MEKGEITRFHPIKNRNYDSVEGLELAKTRCKDFGVEFGSLLKALQFPAPIPHEKVCECHY